MHDARFAQLESDLRRRAEVLLRAGRPLRAWVAPCGDGALAYSVAIVLIETLGRRWRERPLRVLAADPDPAAVSGARAGLFPREKFRWLSPSRRERFFAETAAGLRARRLLRETCLFTATGSASGARPFWRDLVIVDGRLQAPEAPAQGAEPQFQALLAHAEDAVLVCDAQTGAVVEANAPAERLYRRTRRELLALRAADLLAPSNAGRRPGCERRSRQRPQLPQHRRGDGSLFPAEQRTAFMMWRGRPSRLWVVRDAGERLRGGSRAAGDAFMGEVVHELRAPIQVIQGFAETLRQGVRDPQDRDEFLRAIESHSGRVARLVDRLLDLSAAHRGRPAARPQPLAAARAASEVAAAFSPLARRRGVRLTVAVEPGLSALADPSDFPHILGNFLDNAIKFSPRGGTVTLLGEAQGGQALLSVKDAGPGIPPEDLERVFDRFFRSQRTRAVKGTGLGLAIARAMAKANGGRVWAENGKGGGAAFFVALPLAPVLESRA